MKHTFTEQSKHIFCIHGNLEDMICTNHLRKEKFNEFLSEYLRRELGFETVVFYLAARGMRVYDEQSAKLLAENIRVNEEVESVSQDENDWDDDFDESEFDWDNELEEEDQGNTEVQEEPLPIEKKEKEVVYSARIEVTDFIAMMDARLRDTEHKIAFVFESISDYIKVNSENDSQFSATLHYLLTDALDDNQNRVIFLAMNRDLQQIYAEAANDDILRGVLFEESNGRLEYNQEAILSFGRPGRDEIANLLEHYRIYGSKKMGRCKFLTYPMRSLDGLAYLTEQYMAVSNENTLSRLNEFLVEWFQNQPGDRILFDETAVWKMFPKVLPMKLPEQRLKEMEYVDEIWRRVVMLKKYARMTETPESPYDIARFTKSQKDGMEAARRFLISGIEQSNRSEAALVLADFLYEIGEVSHNVPTVIRGAALGQLAMENVSAAVMSWFDAAENSVLIVDDMETMLTLPEHRQILSVFHQVFLRELKHNRMQHFIFVVNHSKVEEVFGEYRECYGIPEANCLKTNRQIPVPVEIGKTSRGDTAR